MVLCVSEWFSYLSVFYLLLARHQFVQQIETNVWEYRTNIPIQAEHWLCELSRQMDYLWILSLRGACLRSVFDPNSLIPLLVVAFSSPSCIVRIVILPPEHGIYYSIFIDKLAHCMKTHSSCMIDSRIIRFLFRWVVDHYHTRHPRLASYRRPHPNGEHNQVRFSESR